MLVHLIVGLRWQRLLGKKITHSLVRLLGQENELHHGYEGGHQQVPEEEAPVSEAASGALKNNAVSEENGGGGVEGARQQGEDETGVSWERVGELEGGY